jgi:hypothetical protein
MSPFRCNVLGLVRTVVSLLVATAKECVLGADVVPVGAEVAGAVAVEPGVAAGDRVQVIAGLRAGTWSSRKS